MHPFQFMAQLYHTNSILASLPKLYLELSKGNPRPHHPTRNRTASH